MREELLKNEIKSRHRLVSKAEARISVKKCPIKKLSINPVSVGLEKWKVL